MRKLSPGLHGLDDLRPGDRAITTALIDAFAEMTGDRFEIHIDTAASQSSAAATGLVSQSRVISPVG